MSRYLLLFFGVFCCSTAVIVLKTTQTHPLLVGAYRLLFATLALAPFFWRDWKRHGYKINKRDFVHLLLPGVFLGIHFASWALGARMTVVANASLLINLAPIAMPFFAYWLIRERVTWREAGGTGLAVGGVALLSWHDISIGGENLQGNIICLLSMLSFTLYLVYGRKYAAYPTVWLYVVPVYAIGGTLSIIIASISLDSIAIASGEEFGRLVILAIVPTVLGHSILNKSLKSIKGQVVSVVNLHQFIFAATMAAFIYGELPPILFFTSAALCSAGAYIVVKEAARVRMEKEHSPPHSND